MKTILVSAIFGALLALSSTAFADGDADDDENSALLEAHDMAGVDGPFVGNANPVRGIAGGGRPWVLSGANVNLSRSGRLDVRVRGLIIPLSAGPGLNPAAFFRATVSCLSIDDAGNPATVNVSTTNGAEVMIGDPQRGNAHIRESVALPSPCIAPIVFVTSASGSWFAATGR